MTLNTSTLTSENAAVISSNFIKKYPELSEGAVITKLEISGCQGARRTGEIELSYDGTDVTNQKSVAKSEVRWIDAKALSFKSTITSRISSLCSRLCIRYSHMWILPVSSMEEFLEEAQEIQREFEAGIEKVLENYEVHIQAEKDRSPKMSNLIDQLKLSKDDFKKSFRFNLAHFIPFNPISVEGDETEGVYQNQLLVDLADEASKVYSKISKNDNMRSSTITRLKQMQSKIISFMFIHKEAAVLADAINHIISNLPAGAINEPRDVAVLHQWFLFMSDVSMLKRIISGEQKITDWLESITRSFNMPAGITSQADDMDPASSLLNADVFGSNSTALMSDPSKAATGSNSMQVSAGSSVDLVEDSGLTLQGW
jgi:hypothetical protein